MQCYATTLASLCRTNTVCVSPTALVSLLGSDGDHQVRALIDQCDPVSRISKRLVRKFGLRTLTAGGQTFCQTGFRPFLGCWSIFRVAMQVDDTLCFYSPMSDIGREVSTTFSGIVLADLHFHRAKPVDIVFGGDVFQRIHLDGVICSPGLPIAQKTIFGFIVSGTCPA